MSARKYIYSKIFSNLFKKFRPYYSYFDYYENLIDQVNYDFLINKFSEKSINNINTSAEISFFSFPFNQEIKQIVKKIGNPRYKFKNPQIPGFNTFFYRKKLASAKITVIMHFLNDRLIMGSYIFDSYNTSFAKQFERQICSKYLLETNQNEIPRIISDTMYNHIEIVHSVDYRINFISGEKSVLTALLKQKEMNTISLKVKAQLAFNNFI